MCEQIQETATACSDDLRRKLLHVYDRGEGSAGVTERLGVSVPWWKVLGSDGGRGRWNGLSSAMGRAAA